MNIKTLGIDIAKNIFQVHGIDYAGNKVINKAIKRNKPSIPIFGNWVAKNCSKISENRQRRIFLPCF